MAKKNSESKTAETEIQPETETPAVKSVDVQKTLVCVGGYNHSAVQSGDTLEINTDGLPAGFGEGGLTEGYFPGDFVKRFNIASQSREGKILKLKITKQT